jgi:hypothetical protein
MCCIILLLENIDSLMQFAQQGYGFMCNLGVIIKITRGNSIPCIMMVGFHFLMMSSRHLKVYWIAPITHAHKVGGRPK